MKPDLQARVAKLFAAQHALAARHQLLAVGVSRREYRVEVDRGTWREVCLGVVQLQGAPATWQQAPMAATLASKHVAVTTSTALRLQGMDGYRDAGGLFLLAPRGTKPLMPPSAQLTTTRRLSGLDVVTVEGIRTTNVATSLVLEVRGGASEPAGKALDDALRRGMSPGWFATTIARWAGGVAGADVLQTMLDERAGKRLPRSWFERLAQQALAERGIVLEHEVPVRDGRRIIARMDLADPECRGGLECQSWEHHSSPAAIERDLARKRRIRELGWDFAECWWTDRNRMDVVAADVTLVIARQRRLLGLPLLAR